MNHSILIVDDSATTRAVIKRTIRLTGLATDLHEAASGEEALALLSSQSVDLVLADLNMAGMNGIEMIRRLKSNDQLRSIPVLVITAEPNASRLEKLKSEGVKGYIRKPFTPEEIRNTLNETLGVVHA